MYLPVNTKDLWSSNCTNCTCRECLRRSDSLPCATLGCRRQPLWPFSVLCPRSFSIFDIFVCCQRLFSLFQFLFYQFPSGSDWCQSSHPSPGNVLCKCQQCSHIQRWWKTDKPWLRPAGQHLVRRSKDNIFSPFLIPFCTKGVKEETWSRILLTTRRRASRMTERWKATSWLLPRTKTFNQHPFQPLLPPHSHVSAAPQGLIMQTLRQGANYSTGVSYFSYFSNFSYFSYLSISQNILTPYFHWFSDVWWWLAGSSSSRSCAQTEPSSPRC